MLVKSKFVILLLVGLMTAGLQAYADNIVADFSASSNPTGNWSYGYTNTLGGAFTLFTVPTTGCGGTIDVWTNSAGFPVVDHNNSGVTQTCSGTVSVPTDVLGMHPSDSGQDAVVRWTAPSAGAYSVAGLFEGLDFVYPTTTDVHILLNSSTSLFSGNIASFEVPLNFSFSQAFSAGDTLDFVVGFGVDGNYFGDSTGLSGTITGAAPRVPEPATLVLLGTGILGLIGGKFRLRRAR